MSLVEKQHTHAMRLARLLLYAESLGYQVTGGDWNRDDRCDYGHPDSLHRLRLATDLNLHKDGVYLTRTKDHKPLGVYWEAMGGSWGGRFPKGDGNHYSTPHNGMR